MKISTKTLIKTSLLLVMSSYMAVLWWDVKKVDRFCEAVEPGFKVTYLKEVAVEYGVNLQNLAGISSGKTKAIIYAIAPLSGGNKVCSIEHDYQYVLKAEVLK